MRHTGGTVTGNQARPTKLLLVDDDREMCRALGVHLRDCGVETEACYCGRTALQKAMQGNYDGLILDVELPMLDGYEVARQVRRRSSMPILLLTSRAAREDRVEGFRAGADDYVTKPFYIEELILRVKALLRRAAHIQPSADSRVALGRLVLDSRERDAILDGRKLRLTGMEFDILDVLSRSPGLIVTRETIWSALHQRELSPLERALDTHMSNLRKKLGGAHEVTIRTVRNTGYLLIVRNEAEAMTL